MSLRSFFVKLLSLALALLGSSLSAGEPTLTSLNLRGLQIGAKTTLTLTGDELGKSPRLLLPFPSKQELKPGNTDKQATFDITLDTQPEPGYYQLRVVTESGVSLPNLIAVDRLPQVALLPKLEALPVAVHGTVSGSTSAETSFVGKAGQKLLVECEAQRLGSKLRPVLHLYNAKRLQLAWAWPNSLLGNDTRLEATLPEDGAYTVTLHDLEYAAQAPSYYRLRLGQWAFVDQVFPPVLSKQTPSEVTLLGPTQPITMPAPKLPGDRYLRLGWPKTGEWSGPRPFVNLSTHAEVVEAAAVGKAQELPALPVGVSGRLLTLYEEDRYRFTCQPGQKLRCELFADRLGSPVTAGLVLQDDTGKDLLRGTEKPGSLDASLEYTVPDKVTALRISVQDTQGRANAHALYRFVLEVADENKPTQAWQLTTPTQKLSLPMQGQAVLPVWVERAGYSGKVTVTAQGLPKGWQLKRTLIDDRMDGGLVVVERAGDLSEPVLVSWQGKSATGEERTLSIKNHPLEKLQPWLATEFALAPTLQTPDELTVTWDKLPTELSLLPGSKLSLAGQFARAKANTPVRVTLLTSQPAQLNNAQPDPTRTIRLEKPVEIAANATAGEVSVLVPVQLTSPAYDLTLLAEQLSADKKSVLATAYAPIQRVPVKYHVALQLVGPTKLEAQADAKTGTVIKLVGKLERREGFAGDVTLAVTGLPKTAKIDGLTVKAGSAEVAITATLPPSTPAVPEETFPIKVTASYVPDAKVPNSRVTMPSVELTVVVKSAGKAG